MNFVTSIVAIAVDSSIRKTKQDVSKQEIKRRELAFTKIALAIGSGTKKSIVTALRADKISGTPVNAENVQKIRKEIDSVRRNRSLYRAKARTSNRISSLPIPDGRLPISLPKSTPIQRLNAIRKEVIETCALKIIHHGAPGGTSFTVQFAAVTSEVDYSTSLGRTYDVYRGAFKGWGANIDNHKIVVPQDWRMRVQRRGLASVGGMLTLDALRLEAPDGIELYAAVWVVQGRGYKVKVERGFIVIQGNQQYHADTVENAIRGIQRKTNRAAMTLATIAEMNLSFHEFAEKYKGIPIDVSLNDARQSGSCEYGIRSWCASVGIDVARVHVPMVELLDAFRKMPLPEVRRAVLHAVRKNRVAYHS